MAGSPSGRLQELLLCMGVNAAANLSVKPAFIMELRRLGGHRCTKAPINSKSARSGLTPQHVFSQETELEGGVCAGLV